MATEVHYSNNIIKFADLHDVEITNYMSEYSSEFYQ